MKHVMGILLFSSELKVIIAGGHIQAQLSFDPATKTPLPAGI
jgi:hypothetical protein